MARSASLRLSDARAIYRLVGECRELGDDTVRWRLHLFAGLATQTGAGVVMGGELVGVRDGRTAHAGLTDWGWENGFDRRGWERAMAEMAADPRLSRTPALAAYLVRMLADDGASLSRADLLADAEWSRSWDHEHLHAAIGVDHTLWCFRSAPGSGAEYSGLLMARAAREPDFTTRQKAIVQEAIAAVAPLVGGPLAGFEEPSPGDLALRVRQVLRCLLEGDGDKQIVARLGITRNTVNQYAKVIFRHFGVQTRAELLARWVKRGWGARFAWADPDLPAPIRSG